MRSRFGFIQDDETWMVTSKGKMIALIVLSGVSQMRGVMLCPGIVPRDALEILRITASHTMRYRVNCSRGRGILAVPETSSATRADSRRMLQDGVVPAEIAGLSSEQLCKALKDAGVDVTQGAVETIAYAIERVLSNRELYKAGVTYNLRGSHGDWHMAEFTVRGKAWFRGWKALGKPTPHNDLYVVPAYHPGIMPGKKATYGVQALSGKLVGEYPVDSISSPGGCWDATNHPFYVEGKKVILKISGTKILGEDGMKQLQSVLVALLGFGNAYVEVYGGFNPSCEHPRTVASRARLSVGEVRGSEGHCAWAYKVLTRERKLKGAHIPEWFDREGWLAAYEKHGNLRSR